MKALVDVAMVLRDLLQIDEQLIRIGRQDFTRKDFETGYIAIDSLGKAERLSSGYKFKNDVMNHHATVVYGITIDFYGDDAYDTATRLWILLNSQTALELKARRNIELLQTSGITDIKALTGQQYGERVQVEFKVIKMISEDIQTLTIEEVQLEIINQNGVFHDSKH